MCVCVSIRICMCMCMYMYEYVCVCVYVCMYVHMYRHTKSITNDVEKSSLEKTCGYYAGDSSLLRVPQIHFAFAIISRVRWIEQPASLQQTLY